MNEPTFPMTNEEAQRYIAAQKEAQAKRPLKATYTPATLGATTERGGEVVTATTGIVVNEHRIARVGDTVRYLDGTESKIVSGAGSAVVYKGQPVAIVGSATANGDTITTSLQSSWRVSEFADAPIPGLLQPGYVPSPNAAHEQSH